MLVPQGVEAGSRHSHDSIPPLTKRASSATLSGMIPRQLHKHLLDAARWYPVVAVTGPRQSGKTTLCQAAFPDKPYRSLEPLDVREHARSDPRGFLQGVADGAILDEVQYAPGLLSYLQDEVDRRPEPGRFILTGSEHFALTHGISQSLAGRAAVLDLLPLGLDERLLGPRPPLDLWTCLLEGGYPRIASQGIPAARWLADYVTTYVQRDVRQVLQVGDLNAFTGFVRLCAGRTGQELNLSDLGADAGITHATARAWLSVLETSMLVFLVPAWHRNVRKQQVRRPKLHFLDIGLCCHLLGIRDADQLHTHPTRGALFESWVASEVWKARAHRGLARDLYHFRVARGPEVDLLIDRGDAVVAIECKSGATVAGDWLAPLLRLGSDLQAAGEHRPVLTQLVYGGEGDSVRHGVSVYGWRSVAGATDWAPAA